MRTKYLINLFSIISLISSELFLAKAEFKLDEINPDFNYAEWYKKETGFTPNAQWFGCWTIAPRGDELYFGFATARPAEFDGAILAKFSGEWLITLGQFSEQGVHCIKWIGDTLYGIGSDPSIGDGWDGGNFYRYFPYSGEFEKVRYDSKKKPVLPNVLHSWGLCFDSSNSKFYVSTGSYDAQQYSKNGGNCGNPNDSTLACFGQVWQSDDKGSSWSLNAGDRFNVLSNYRIYDVINYNDAIYITDGEMSNSNKLKKSGDDGKKWQILDGLNPAALFRMSVFKNRLIVAANFARTYYTIDENNNSSTLTMPGALNYSFNVFANVEDRFLVTYFSDGSIYYTSDLLNWNEILPASGRNFLSIAYWEKEKSIVLAERGVNGTIWKLNITDLLNTGVKVESEPEITVISDNNFISIKTNGKEIFSVKVFDVLGNIIEESTTKYSGNFKFNISQLTPGPYIICCKSYKNYFIRKILKY